MRWSLGISMKVESAEGLGSEFQLVGTAMEKTAVGQESCYLQTWECVANRWRSCRTGVIWSHQEECVCFLEGWQKGGTLVDCHGLETGVHEVEEFVDSGEAMWVIWHCLHYKLSWLMTDETSRSRKAPRPRERARKHLGNKQTWNAAAKALLILSRVR